MIIMFSLRLLRCLARRPRCAPRNIARPRLAVERLETRDLLATSVAVMALPVAALPSPSPMDRAYVEPLRLEFIEDDRGTPLVVIEEERLVVVIAMPPMFMHGVDGWGHEAGHPPLERIPLAPALAGEVSSLSRVPPGVDPAPMLAPVHADAIGPAIAAEAPRAGSISAPMYTSPLVALTPSLPLTVMDHPVAFGHVLNPMDFARPGVAEQFLVGVPGPKHVSTIDPEGAPGATARYAPEPAALPWLAGLLTPVAQFDSGESLLALERLVGEAHGWGRALAGKLAALLASPWTAGAAVAIAAMEVCRRRARHAVRRDDAELDAPQITGPSQLV
jgi:hypothetical protein